MISLKRNREMLTCGTGVGGKAKLPISIVFWTSECLGAAF